jgi:hypothetical protein
MNKKRLAIISLCCGIFALINSINIFILRHLSKFHISPDIFYLCVAIVMTAGIACGHIVRRTKSDDPETKKSRRAAFIGLSLSYLSLVVLFIIAAFIWYLRGAFEGVDLGKGSKTVVDEKATIRLLNPKKDIPKIESGVLIKYPSPPGKTYWLFPYDYLDWKYDFPGFEKTDLSSTECEEIIRIIRSGTIYFEDFKKENPKQSSPMERKIQDLQFLAKNKMGINTQSMGVLMKLSNRSVGFFNLLSSTDTTFVGIHLETGIFLGMANQAINPQLITRTHPSSIEILFPELNANDAIKKTQSYFDSGYSHAIEALKQNRELISAIGPIKEIRPAKGENAEGHWQDYTGSYFFRVEGASKTAGTQVQIVNDTLTIQFISDGRVAIPQMVNFK